MLILLSPAKSLDFASSFDCSNFTQPFFAKESEKLIVELKKISSQEIAKMMNISEKLADLNFDRFQNFSKEYNLENARQALLAFDGDVYAGIDKSNFNQKDFDFAQQHLRILSGLYGILKPLDLIQPYRLEMGLNLKMKIAKNLYQFWGDKITDFLNEEKEEVLINLASEEYFSAINCRKINKKIINVSFKEKKNGALKVIGISSKKARGLMTNFSIINKIKDPKQLKEFHLENYRFEKNLSDDLNFIFTR